MDRFDSMRGKQLLGGASGSGYGKLGTQVTVEAQTSFNAGDRFVGVKNDATTMPTLQIARLATTSLLIASEDLSVAVMNQSITNDSESLIIGFLNEYNEYEQYNVSLPTMNFKADITLSTLNTVINEDGSIIMVYSADANSSTIASAYNYLGVLIINVDVSNKTASASYKTNPFNCGNMEYSDGNNTYSVETDIVSEASKILLTKKYVLLKSMYRGVYTNSSGSIKNSNGYIGGLFRYSGGSAISKPFLTSSSTATNYSWETCGWRDDDTLVAVLQSSSASLTSIIYKISPSTGSASQATLPQYSTSYTDYYRLSENGRYLGRGVFISSTDTRHWVYSINADLSLNDVWNIQASGSDTAKYTYPDNTATYIIFGNGGNIYATSDSSVDFTEAPAVSSKYFGIRNGEFYRSGTSKIYLSPQSSEPEYLISFSDGDATEANKIYGIVPINLAEGAINVAQLLFTT